MSESQFEISPEQKQSALLTVMRKTLHLSAHVTASVSAFGAIAVIASNTDPATLPPALATIAGSVGVNVLSNILDRVARGDANDEEIEAAVLRAIEHSNLPDALQQSEFQREIGRVFREFHHLRILLRQEHETLEERLFESFRAYPALFDELADSFQQLQQDVQDIKDHILEEQIHRTPEHMNAVVERALVNQIDQQAELITNLSSRLTGLVRNQLQVMRIAWQEGRRSEVLEWVSEVRSDGDQWNALPSEDRSELLCFAASLELEQGNLEAAIQFLYHANSLRSSERETRLRALIAYREGRPNQALELLEDLEETPSINLRVTLLLETGQIEQAKSILPGEDVSPEHIVETLRVRALFYLTQFDITQARIEIQKALELAPRWRGIRFAGAVIDYYSALSPAALPNYLIPLPEPVEWVLVKQDDESVKRLQSAASMFNELADNMSTEENMRLMAWHFACLANILESQPDAIDACQSILDQDVIHPVPIAWIAARGLTVDLSRSEQQLESLMATGNASPAHILSLVRCYLASQRFALARSVLEESRVLFQNATIDFVWVATFFSVLISLKEYDQAMAILDSLPGGYEQIDLQEMSLLVQAKVSGNWAQLITYWENQYGATQDPVWLLKCCEAMYQRQNWDYVADRAKQFVNAIDTEEAYQVAIHAAYQTNQYQLCLDLIGMYREREKSADYFQRLSLFQINALEAVGRLTDAILEAEHQAQINLSFPMARVLGRLYYLKGDVKNLAVMARQFRDRTDADPKWLLGLVNLIKEEDAPLAVDLFRKVVSGDLPDELVGPAINQGFSLTLENELEDLSLRMQMLGREGQAGILMFHTS